MNESIRCEMCDAEFVFGEGCYETETGELCPDCTAEYNQMSAEDMALDE